MSKNRVCMFLAFIVLTASAAAGDLRFAIIGDRSGSVNQKEFEKVVTDISRMRPDLVLTVGDMPDDASENDWIIALKTLAAIPAPIYYTPGNNDIVDEESAARYTLHTGRAPYYSFDAGDVHFLVLDNSIAGNSWDMGEEQLRWAEKDLRKHRRAALKIVFMHKPFWADTVAKGRPAPLHEIFKEYGVSAVFTGHWHQYAHNVFDGIDYYLVGSSGGGFPFEDDSLGMFYQYMWCTVEDGRLYPVLMRSGHTVDTDIMSIEEEQTVYALQSGRFITASCTSEGYASLSVTNINEYDMTVAPVLHSDSVTGLPAIPEATIAPGAEWRHDFKFTPKENTLDTPALSFQYTFGREKSYKYNAPLALIRRFVTSGEPGMPEIDGVISPGEWDTFAQTVSFYPVENNSPYTQLYLGKDKEYLYAAVVIEKTFSTGLKVQAAERDEEVYLDPSAGFIFTADGFTFYQVYINESGTIWDMEIDTANNSSDIAWNGSFDSAVKNEDGRWVLEYKIPLKDLGAGPGDEIFVNFRRKEPSGRDLFLTLPWDLTFKKYAVIR